MNRLISFKVLVVSVVFLSSVFMVAMLYQNSRLSALKDKQITPAECIQWREAALFYKPEFEKCQAAVKDYLKAVGYKGE